MASPPPVIDWTGWTSDRIHGFGDTWRAISNRTLVLRGRGAGMRAPLRRSALSAKFAWRGSERYRLGGRSLSADDDGWILIAVGELYESEIAPGPEVHTLAAFFDERFLAAARAARHQADELAPGEPPAGGFEPLRLGRRRLPYDPALIGAVTAAAHDPHPLALGELLHVALDRILDAAADARRERERLPCVRAATRDELHRRLVRAHELLMTEYASPLDLPRLATAAAMAPHHFLRRFRDAFGITPHRALVARRLERARHLLATTRRPIADIAAAVGFETAAAFATRFRRDTGLTPRAYRDAVR